MQITWNGHSNIMIRGKNTSVLIDPFFAYDKLVPKNWQELLPLDLVLITHDHADHVGSAIDICKQTGASLGCIFGTAQKLQQEGLPEALTLNSSGFNIGGTIAHKDIKVTMTPAMHSSNSAAPAGYIIHIDGKNIYHSGDTCIFSDMALFAELYPLDLALLPIGGVFTMDARQAAKACQLLQVPKVIPLHFHTFPALEQSTDAFKETLLSYAPSCTCIDLKQGQSFELN